MMWFVPGDYDVSDLEGNGQDEPWQLVHAIVGFAPFPVEFEHTHEDDGETHTGTIVEGHPIVLMPCKEHGSVGHAPARAYPGSGTVFSDYKSAHREAEQIIESLLKEKNEVDALEAMINGPDKES